MAIQSPAGKKIDPLTNVKRGSYLEKTNTRMHDLRLYSHSILDDLPNLTQFDSSLVPSPVPPHICKGFTLELFCSQFFTG